MRRRAVLAVWCVALVLVAGCAGARARRDDADTSSGRFAQRQQLSQEAQAALDRKDYPSTLAILDQLSADYPKSAELHCRRGKVLELLGRDDSAESAYRRALDLEPEYVTALIGLGRIESRRGRHTAALERIETAVEVEPHQADAHFARGQMLEALWRTDEALAAYFRTLELDPADEPAILRIATLQLDRGQPEQALVRLDQAVDLAPDDSEARHRRGLAHLALNHSSLALADLQYAASHLPDRAEVLIHLAQALEADRKPGPALEAAERALRLAPDSPVARDLSQRLRR